MSEGMTEVIRLRVPEHLVEALRVEARRRMTSQASLIRLAVGRELGLFDDHGAEPNGDGQQEPLKEGAVTAPERSREAARGRPVTRF